MQRPNLPAENRQLSASGPDCQGFRVLLARSVSFAATKTLKKLKDMFVHTVMSEPVVRYLVNVRVCYLLLGWW